MSFENAWTKFHAGAPPVGWMLRKNGVGHWVRFHSHPESKRYVETDEERSALLARHNTLAGEVLATAPCWLAQAFWVERDDEAALREFAPFRAARELKLEFAFSFSDGDDEQQNRWRVYARKTEWSSGRFDELLLAVADEEVAPTLWLGGDGAVFAPYAGGVDVFLPEAARVARMAERHRDWLSKHPSGL